jgi:hypothetical protein
MHMRGAFAQFERSLIREYEIAGQMGARHFSVMWGGSFFPHHPGIPSRTRRFEKHRPVRPQALGCDMRRFNLYRLVRLLDPLQAGYKEVALQGLTGDWVCRYF